MENNMRTEFEQCVQMMVEEISENIFLEKLEEICENYSKQLSKYEKAVKDNQKVDKDIELFVKNNINSITNLESSVIKELEMIQNTVDGISKEYKDVFEQFSKQIMTLNDSEREKFINDLQNNFQNNKEKLISEFSEKCTSLFNPFLEEMTMLCLKEEDTNKKLEDILNSTTKTNYEILNHCEEQQASFVTLEKDINNGLSDVKVVIHNLNQEYEKIFGVFSKKVNSLNKEERKNFLKELHRTIEELEENIPTIVEQKCLDVIDIFVIKLTEVCKQNTEQIQQFEVFTKDIEKSSQELLELTKQSINEVQELDKDINEHLLEIKDVIDNITNEYDTVFSGFSQNVTSLNENEREKLKKEINQLLVSYRSTFAEEIRKKYEHISENFRKDLEDIYLEYYEQLSENTNLLENSNAYVEELKNCAKQHSVAIKELDEKLEKNFSTFQTSVENMKTDVNVILQEYSKEVGKLNEKEIEHYNEGIKEIFQREENNLSIVIDKKINNLEQSFENFRTNLQDDTQRQQEIFNNQMKELKENNSQIQNYTVSLVKTMQIVDTHIKEQQKYLVEIMKYMKMSYKEQFDNYIDKIHENDKKEREEYINSIHNLIETQKKEIEKLSKRQEEIMEKMLKNQEFVLAEIAYNQREQNKQFLMEYNEQILLDEEKEEAVAWKFYMGVSNLFLMVLISVLTIMLEPWEKLGWYGSIGCIAFSVIVTLLIVFRRNIVHYFKEMELKRRNERA